jgi:hypothetical protein
VILSSEAPRRVGAGSGLRCGAGSLPVQPPDTPPGDHRPVSDGSGGKTDLDLNGRDLAVSVLPWRWCAWSPGALRPGCPSPAAAYPLAVGTLAVVAAADTFLPMRLADLGREALGAAIAAPPRHAYIRYSNSQGV